MSPSFTAARERLRGSGTRRSQSRGEGAELTLPHADALSPPLRPAWHSSRVQGIPEIANGSRRDAAQRRGLVLADVIAAYVALYAVIALVPGQLRVSLLPSVVALAPFVVFVAKAIGLYDRDQYILRKTSLDELPALLNLSVVYALAVWLAEEVLFRGWLSRPQVLTLVAFSFGAFTVGRMSTRWVMTRLTTPERLIVLGDSDDAARIAAKLQSTAGVNAVVAGRVALHPTDGRGHSGSSEGLTDPIWLTDVIVEEWGRPGHHRARGPRPGGDPAGDPPAQGARRQGQRAAPAARGGRLVIDLRGR